MRSKIKIILLLCLILTGCKEKTYKITFDTNGGSVMKSITIKEGENIKDIETPTKEGYLFVTWLKDGTPYNQNNPVNEDINLTATWIETPKVKDTYTITYIIDNYEDKEVVRENTTINERKAPKKENYTFLGWYHENKLFDFNTKITKDIVLTAKYELNKVTITYELDGGTGQTSEDIYINSTPNIPVTPVKDGYRFLKWTLDNKDFSFNTKVTKDITIKAIWEKIEYVIVQYDTDKGNTINSETIEKYSKLKKLPTPKKEGYKFIEWQLNNQKFDIDTKITTDIVLKATYEKE